MGEAKLRRTKTNHEFPRVKEISDDEMNFLHEAARNAPLIPAGRYEVAKVGMFRDGLITCQTTDYTLYRLHSDLMGWANMTIDFALQRALTFPCDIEFDYNFEGNGRATADFVL